MLIDKKPVTRASIIFPRYFGIIHMDAVFQYIKSYDITREHSGRMSFYILFVIYQEVRYIEFQNNELAINGHSKTHSPALNQGTYP